MIIPVYNVEPYLRRCLDSVVNQTYQNMEMILVDDGSMDHCGHICDEYAKQDHRIRVIHKKNGGLSAARNDALKLVTGDWILFVDSDDWCEPDLCKSALEKAKESNADIVIFSPFKNHGQNQKIIHAFDSDFVTSDKTFIFQLQLSALDKHYTPLSKKHEWGQGFPWDKLFRASLILDNQLLFSENVKANEDVIFNIHAFQHANTVCFFDKQLYHWRMNPNSIGHKYTPDRVQIDREIYKEMKRTGEIYKLPEEFKRAINVRIVSNTVLSGTICFYHPMRRQRLAQKIGYAREVINSEPICSAFRDADWNKLRSTGKLMKLCKRYRAQVLYVIVKVKQLCKRC